MTRQRVMRILRPAVALVVLTLTLVVLGVAVTGSAAASSPQAHPTATPLVTGGETQGAIVRFGEDVTVPAGERVDAVFAGGGDVTVDGTVVGSVVAFGGDVTVHGTVENDIVAFGGDVFLAQTAVVGSTMSPQDKSVVVVGGTLTRAPGAQVTGGVQRVDNANWAGSLGWVTQHTVVRPWWGFTLMGWIVQTAFFLVLALVAAALLPRQLRAVQRNVTLKPAGSLGWGALVFFIAGPAVLVVLVISIVGWLVLIPYVLLAMLAYFFAVTAVGAFVAQRVLAGSGQHDNLMLATALGVIGTTIVSRIPVLGGFVIVAMILFGTGGIALAIAEWRRDRKLAAVPAGTPLAGPPGTVAAAPGTVAAPSVELATALTVGAPEGLGAAEAAPEQPAEEPAAEGPPAEE